VISSFGFLFLNNCAHDEEAREAELAPLSKNCWFSIELKLASPTAEH
jgi:hypothetical protein